MKKFFIFLTLYTLQGCHAEREFTIDLEAELLKFGEIGELYIRAGKNNGLSIYRISKSELLLEGSIEKGDYIKFLHSIDKEINTIVLNSFGGRVSKALKIANEIHEKKLNVRINGFCISSCANYLFLSGNKKTINGILGFHGSASVSQKIKCIADSSFCLENKTSESEKIFFSKIYAPIYLFEITQSKDKGMKDGKIYSYYAPNTNILKRMGIDKISGDQNLEYLHKLQLLFNKYNIIEYNIAVDPNPSILNKLENEGLAEFHKSIELPAA